MLMITKATAYIGLSHLVGTYFGVRRGVNGRDCNCLDVFYELWSSLRCSVKNIVAEFLYKDIFWS